MPAFPSPFGPAAFQPSTPTTQKTDRKKAHTSFKFYLSPGLCTTHSQKEQQAFFSWLNSPEPGPAKPGAKQPFIWGDQLTGAAGATQLTLGLPAAAWNL